MPIHLEMHIPAAAILFLEIAQMAVGKAGAAATSVKSTSSGEVSKSRWPLSIIPGKKQSQLDTCVKKRHIYVCVHK